MNYVILQKARPYSRTRRGRFEHVKGYARFPATYGGKKLNVEESRELLVKLRDEAFKKVRAEFKDYLKKHPDEPKIVFHGTVAKNVYKILFEGVSPQSYHNFDASYYEGKRKNRIFVVDNFSNAAKFAFTAESHQNSPAVVVEAVIPVSYWKSKSHIDDRYGLAFMLPEIKPNWIRNIYDAETGLPITKTINSLTLERFEKAGKVVYIPITLAVLRKILGGD